MKKSNKHLKSLTAIVISVLMLLQPLTAFAAYERDYAEHWAETYIAQSANSAFAPTSAGLAPVEHPQNAWLHWDDFETDKAGTTVTNPRAARINGVGMGGSRALRLDYGAAPNTITDALRVSFPAQTEIFYRYYMRKSANWPVGTPLGLITRLNQFHQQTGIGVTATGGLRRNWDGIPRTAGVPDATALSLAPTAANIGRWIPIEVRMVTTGGAGGTIQVWIDDVLSFSNTNIAINVPNFTSLDLILFPDSPNIPAGAHVYIDNLVISTEKIGLACFGGCEACLAVAGDTRLSRFLLGSGRRQQPLSDTRTHYDITMEPGTPEFVISLWPRDSNAQIWANGVRYAHGQPITFNLAQVTPRPAFADASTGNRSWGIVDHAGIFEIAIVPPGGTAFQQIYTFSAEMLMPYTVVETPRPEWLWWDDFSNWSVTQGSYAGRGNPQASSTTAFFNPTPGTGLGGTHSLEARFRRDIIGDYGAFSAPDVSLQFNDPWGTNVTRRPDGLPLPPGRSIDYEVAGFPAGTNAMLDARGDIDDMFVRFYLRMDKHWGDYLLWNDPSFWGPNRPGGAAGNNGQQFIGTGSGGGHDKLMRFMGRTHGTNYTRPGPFSGRPALGPQTMANGAIGQPTNGAMAQTFILHSWTMGQSHPHYFLGLDPASGVDIFTTNHGGQRLWQQQWPGTPPAQRLPGVAFRAWDRTNWFNTAEAAWNFKRAELQAQFNTINAVNRQPLAQRPPGAMPGTAAPGSGHVVITERSNDFNYLNWLGASTSGGQFPNIPIFDSDHVGEWYLVEQRVRLNTPGRSDGIMQLWIDEKLVVERTNINFRGWNIDAGITRIQLEVYANSPRGATVDASRYISHLVVSTEYIGPATFVPSSPLEGAKRELRATLAAEIGADFARPMFILEENAYTAQSWANYAAAISAAITVYNTSDDISQINAAGQLVLSTKAALVAREVVLVEQNPAPQWLFWQDFDGNTGGAGNLQVQGIGHIANGAGIGGGNALRSTMQQGDTARLSFPAQNVAYIRFYTRSGLTTPAGGGFWVRAYNNQNWGANAIRFNADGSGSISIQDGATLPGTSGVLSSTVWVCVELRFDMIARTITTWVDGRLQGTVAIPAAVTAAQIASFQFHNFTGHGTGFRYYDNFVVSTSYIGPMNRQFVTDKTALTAAVTAQIGANRGNWVFVLDEASYTAESWAAYIASINAAIAIETNTGATQSEVDAATIAITTARDALVLLPLDPRANWLLWSNFGGDTGSIAGSSLTVGTGGAIGPYGVTGQGLRHTVGASTTPITIQFPAQEVVYVRFDMRSGVTGLGNESFWARVHNGQDWGTFAFRLNAWANGSISSAGRPTIAGTQGVLTSNTWVGVELRFDIPARTKTIWIDGVLIGTSDLQPGRTIEQISTFQLHNFTDMGVGHRFYDNFVVSTSRIGEVDWPTDKTALTALIDLQVSNRSTPVFVLTAAQYTASTWTAYANAVIAAIAVEANANATQAAVDTAIADLTAARAALVTILTALTTAIDAQFVGARSGGVFVLSPASYTTASWTAFVATINNAIIIESNVNATQTEIDTAIGGIATAIAALVPAERENWLYWNNFDGDTGGVAGATFTPGPAGAIGPFGITGQGFRNTLQDSTTPLTIQFPAADVVYIRFDVRSNVAGAGYGFWARVHNGQDWGTNSFRLNAAANGSITSQGAGAVTGTAGSLLANTWQGIEIRFDITARTKTIWIDGVLTGTGNLEAGRTISQISRFQLHSFNGQGTGTRDYDNFVVSTSRIGSVGSW